MRREGLSQIMALLSLECLRDLDSVCGTLLTPWSESRACLGQHSSARDLSELCKLALCPRVGSPPALADR